MGTYKVVFSAFTFSSLYSFERCRVEGSTPAVVRERELKHMIRWYSMCMFCLYVDGWEPGELIDAERRGEGGVFMLALPLSLGGEARLLDLTSPAYVSGVWRTASSSRAGGIAV